MPLFSRYLMIITILLSTAALAQDQVVQLDTGQQVILHNNFTWEYLSADESSHLDRPATLSIPLNSKNRQVRVVPGETMSLLQLTRSGLDLLLANPEYQSNQLVITTNLTNQGTASIIRAVIEYRIMDAENKVLDSGRQVVWQSIKRLSSSYLRAGTIETGNQLKFNVPKKDQYWLEASIDEVEVR
ncbi:hypothetical protein EOPP23_16360 [Endozoicomonas sp. OPT23]|uniref:DUF3157 family protein n=1 Tax=Endozoicomonas sp. OPT23 TaxID=2072845 RepID=UPI00129AA940|nr:DUF3157 family protein [Endozoicomonas sp. OPT23]MRI34560.1 hypothetical protein [Endozoicomonas sp. OPT23]